MGARTVGSCSVSVLPRGQVIEPLCASVSLPANGGDGSSCGTRSLQAFSWLIHGGDGSSCGTGSLQAFSWLIHGGDGGSCGTGSLQAFSWLIHERRVEERLAHSHSSVNISNYHSIIIFYLLCLRSSFKFQNI